MEVAFTNDAPDDDDAFAEQFADPDQGVDDKRKII